MARRLEEEDLVGKRFGRWTITGIDRRENRQIYVNVTCDCGTKSVVPYHSSLVRGMSRSCGCLSAELASQRMDKARVKKLHEAWMRTVKDGIGTQQLSVKTWKHNTSGYKGVSFLKKNKKWRATIYLRGKQHYLGSFATKEEAYQARLRAEEKVVEYLEGLEEEDRA